MYLLQSFHTTRTWSATERNVVIVILYAGSASASSEHNFEKFLFVLCTSQEIPCTCTACTCLSTSCTVPRTVYGVVLFF